MTVQATFAATLVDEWVRCGVVHAVVSPGSRSTPLALALAAHRGMRVHLHHDERAGCFTALGIGKATGNPAVVLCTSGTAAAELHPAVVEAHQARVPMLVCTADRPPELQSVGAPQTIDQTHLFGRAVRWFVEPGVADDATRSTWRTLAARAFVEATGYPSGPVHLNLAFRDPLVGEPGDLPAGRPDGESWHRGRTASATVWTPGQLPRRGLIVAGGGAQPRFDARWPVLADALSGWRVPGSVGAFDAILRARSDLVPDMVVRLGDAPASKVLAQWLASIEAPHVVAGASWVDPERTGRDIAGVVAPFAADPDEAWLGAWRRAESAAQRAIDDVLGSHDEVTEPHVARTVAAHASRLVVASSMPVRDVEWYAEPRAGLVAHANRGANGIDGVVSTAAGVAIGTGEPVTALVGDLAFLHDANALVGLGGRGIELTIVVVDNRGGGIFSFLPQATELAADRFEQLFGTPHDVDLVALTAAHGIGASVVERAADLAATLDQASGVQVVVASTDRQANVGVHDEINRAVAVAVTAS